MKINKLPSIDHLTAADFEKFFFHPGKPVVIRGGAKDFNTYKLWSPTYLEGKLGNKIVNVTFSEKGSYSVTKKNEFVRMRVPFNEASKRIRDKKGRLYYLQKAEIKHFPELLPDLDTPKWFGPSDQRTTTNLWYGGIGCLSPLHFDESQNFLVQIMGRKKIALFSPKDTDCLYKTKPNLTIGTLSQVDINNPNLKRFPLYAKASRIDDILYPGDILFIPSFWWHQVESLDLSISINYWWRRDKLGKINTVDHSEIH